MDFSPWTVLQDIGIVSGLIIIGQILRAKFKIFQKSLIPAPLIAGFLGLILGPNIMGVLPLSAKMGTYASILIVVVFAAMPIGQKVTKESLLNRNVGGMFFNVTGMLLLQYGLSTLLSLYVLGYFFNLHPGFGVILPVGFANGHGTAAAVGSTFAALGWAEATDLGMTSATMGIVGGIIFGVILINWGARKGYTSYVKDPKNLSSDLLTGLIPPDQQKQGGRITVSSICIDPLTFHLSLILVASMGGYMTSRFVQKMYPLITLPDFAVAMIYGFLIQVILSKTKTDKYVDRYTISKISGCATDLLVVCGVASVKISAVMTYLVPLIVLFSFGYLLVILWFRFVAPWCSDKDWFERGMIAFGQALGVLATGILLLRIVDPELRSNAIEDSGTINLLNRPIVIGLQMFMPYLLCQGGIMPYVAGWVCMAGFFILLICAFVFKWIQRPTGLISRQ